MSFGNAIKEGNTAFKHNRMKAMTFFRHHLIEELKIEYLNVCMSYGVI